MLSSARQLGREGPEQMKASKAMCTSNAWLLPQASQGPKLGREVRCCSETETQPRAKDPNGEGRGREGKGE